MKGFFPLDYWQKGLNRYVNFVRYGLIETPWRFYTDIHPKSETQWKHQQFLAGISPRYSNWMVARSRDEQSRNTRNYYNIGRSDITYPWLSGISGGNTAQALGSAAKGAWQFSKNLSRLYR